MKTLLIQILEGLQNWLDKGTDPFDSDLLAAIAKYILEENPQGKEREYLDSYVDWVQSFDAAAMEREDVIIAESFITESKHFV